MKSEQKWVAVIAAFCLSPVASLADVPTYRFVELITPHDLRSDAMHVNEEGVVVGSYEGHACIWIEGVPRDLGLGAARVVNSGRTVLGSYGSEEFIWDAENGRRALPIDYFDRLTAHDINDSGQIVGTGENLNPYESWAYIYEGGSVTLLAPEGATSSSATAINEPGHVAGNWPAGGFLYQDGQALDFDIFPGWEFISVAALNDLDVIVGTAYRTDPSWLTGAFKYDAASDVWTDLPTVGGRSAWANSINNAGQVTGWIEELGLVLWQPDGTIVMLNDLIPAGSGWVWGAVRTINNHGVMAGTVMQNHRPKAILLVPGVCAGDIVGNNFVDLSDLAAFLASFGRCAGEANFQPLADLNADGCVGLEDLGEMLAMFGTSCW